MQPDRNLSDEQPPKVQSAPLPDYTPSPTATPVNPTPTASLESEKLVQPETTSSEAVAHEVQGVSMDDESVGGEPVHWQAHEYVHHEKSAMWFIVFG